MPLSKIYDVADSYCAVPGGTSEAAISRAIRKRMSCGPITWKRTSNRPINKFLPENVNYCQEFLDYMSAVDPCKIKCFDEAGFKMPDFANPISEVHGRTKRDTSSSCWCGRYIVR